VLKVVDVLVLSGVAVRIALELGDALDSVDVLDGEVIEELAGSNGLDLTVLKPLGRILGCEKDAARRPGELVAERIVIVGRRRQTATVAGEEAHTTTFGTRMVDETHGRHVISAGIDAALVEQNDVTGLGVGLERGHFRRDVRGGEKVLAMLDRQFRHLHVVDVREQRQHGVDIGQQGVDGGHAFVAFHIDLLRCRIRRACAHLRCLVQRARADPHTKVHRQIVHCWS
jgi:hypothetical protein